MFTTGMFSGVLLASITWWVMFEVIFQGRTAKIRKMYEQASSNYLLLLEFTHQALKPLTKQKEGDK